MNEAMYRRVVARLGRENDDDEGVVELVQAQTIEALQKTITLGEKTFDALKQQIQHHKEVNAAQRKTIGARDSVIQSLVSIVRTLCTMTGQDHVKLLAELDRIEGERNERT